MGIGVLVVALASLFVLVGTAAPTSVKSSRRVVAEPSYLLPKQQLVAAPQAPARGASTDCPQMNNPGGLRWQPSAQAGPWPTGGTVKLPRFGVAAPIVRVGVDLSGQMVVPRNARDIAWLDQGPFPGDTNNVVLAGHIRYSGVQGSFGRLQEVAVGDLIDVELDGKQHQFQVRWACLFDFNTTLAEQIMGYTEAPSVTLISCGGVFDRAAGTHNKRVAVRAELVSSA